MTASNIPFNTFNGGEIGKEAMARVDLEIYPACAEVMENVFPLMQGPMIKAPGSEYIGQTYHNSTAIVRPFVFSVDQSRVLEITDSRIDIVNGNSYVDIYGAAATIGVPVDNGSTGSSVVNVSSYNVDFHCGSGEAAAYWPITGGESGKEVTFRFQIERRPLKIRVGTSVGAADISLPGGVYELTLDPGVHVISFTPSASTYYIRVRLADRGTATMSGLTRLAAGDFYVPSPWLEADLSSLRYRQSLDTYWLYHPNYRTRVLERRSNTSWSLRFFRPQDGPFEAPNSTDVTLTASTYLGHATVNASASMFSDDNIGQLLELTHQGQTVVDSFTGVDQASAAIRVFGTETARIFSFNIAGTFTATVVVQRSVNEIDWQDIRTYTAPTGALPENDGLDNQIIYYRLKCTAYTSGTIDVSIVYSAGLTTGRAEIVQLNNSQSVEVEISEQFGSTLPTTTWSLGAWSDSFGWPAAGTLDNGSHCLVRDDRFWKSVADDYESFLLGTEASDAMARRFGTGEMNSARWIESGKRLLLGTSGAELEITSNALDEPITPLNSRLRGFDDNGSADAQAVRGSGNRILFIDRTRARLLQCLFDSQEGDQHDTDDLTRLHNDIAGLIDEEAGTGGFVEIAFQRRPEPRVWCVRDDGEVAVLLFGPREGVYAWSRWKPANGGLVRSVCVVPGRPEDRVHIIIEREVDGEARIYHERIALQRFPVVVGEDGVRTAPDAWRLQSALYSSDETPTDHITGLDHLEGERVSVWADGRVHPSRVVSGGEIELDGEYNTVLVGLNYVGYWKSAKLAYGAQGGTALTMDKQVGRLGFVTLDTPDGAFVYGRSFAAAIDEAQRDGAELTMDSPLELWSSDHSQPFEGASDIDARVCLVMATPAPVTILAMVPAVELHEQS